MEDFVGILYDAAMTFVLSAMTFMICYLLQVTELITYLLPVGIAFVGIGHIFSVYVFKREEYDDWIL